jgi:hypothetical protein
MPVAVHITPHNMSREDYDRVIAELDASGAGEPEGRLFHAAYGDDEVHMFEVWDSPENFDAHRSALRGDPGRRGGCGHRQRTSASFPAPRLRPAPGRAGRGQAGERTGHNPACRPTAFAP